MAVVLGATIALATSGSASATSGSGLFGVVTRGPITPVCSAEQPCTAPASGAVLVFFRSGRQVAKITTDRDGSYRVRLAPGLYTLGQANRRIEPGAIRVRVGRMLRIDFSIDTGIR